MVLNRHQPTPRQSASGTEEDFGARTVWDRVRPTLRVTPLPGSGFAIEFQALGTLCRMTLAGPKPAAEAFVEQTLGWMARFESKYSRFLPGSLISRINDQAGKDWVVIDPETERLFALCQELHFLSKGVMDPTVLPLLRLWNWKARPAVVPSEEAIREAMSRVGWSRVQRAPGRVRLPEAGMALDLGGIGKEHAVDQVVLLSRGFPLTGVLVDFGADIRVLGLPPDGRQGWHIGLEEPRSPGRVWCGLVLREGGVATSGNYLRFFESCGVRYGHILDPRTGRPTPSEVLSVSVVAPSCTQAGFLSTTALVLGPVEGMRLIESTPGVSGAIVTTTQTIQSRRFHEHRAS